jgi:hypothetical protein
MEKQNVVKHSATPVDLIQSAMSSGADLEKLEKLLILQERWEANEARKAYHRAMAEFKSNQFEILKDRKVDFSTAKGRVSYNHASLHNVVQTVTAELSKYGLSASWRLSQSDKMTTVVCRVTHELGHSEETSLTAPADESGSKNTIQAIGSAISYLQRYSLLSILGLATKDQDTDGITEAATITEAQAANVRAQIVELKSDEAKLLKFVGAEKIESMTKEQYAKAQAALHETRQRQGGK